MWVTGNKKICHGSTRRHDRQLDVFKGECPCVFLVQVISLVNLLGELSTSFELNDILCGNLDLSLGGGVNTLASFFLNYLEGAKSDEGNLLTILQCTTYRAEHCIKSGLSLSLVKIGLLGDCLY